MVVSALIMCSGYCFCRDLHVVNMPVQVTAGFSSFPPTADKHGGRWIGYVKLPEGVNMCTNGTLH